MPRTKKIQYDKYEIGGKKKMLQIKNNPGVNSVGLQN